MKGETVIVFRSSFSVRPKVFNQTWNIKNSECKDGCSLNKRVHQCSWVAILAHYNIFAGVQVTIATSGDNHISVTTTVTANKGIDLI